MLEMVADLTPSESESLLKIVILVILEQCLLFVIENGFDISSLHFVE